MKLIDKSALVAEIEKRIEHNTEWKDACKTLAVLAANQAIEEDKKILSIIDTLEVKYLQEEPVSEELEEAANKYAKESYPDELSTGQFGTGDYEPYVDMSWQRECAVEDFKAGAEWQKKQDQSTIELAEDHAMLAGMEKMKEEMMKNAVDAVVETDANGLSCVNVDGVDVGDKVKVIVIKED